MATAIRVEPGLTHEAAESREAVSDRARTERSYNPYLAARREWDERYGDLISRAQNWRRAAFLSGLVALVATGGVVRLSMETRVIPYVVAIDALGRPLAAAPAQEASAADEGRLRRAALFAWLENLRLVTVDAVAQRKAIDRVYAYVANGSQAQAAISEYYRAGPPHKRAATETVGVDIKSVLPTSEKTYEVDWIETTRDLYGKVKSQDRWKGSFTIAVNPPNDERLVRVNPLGVYVTNAHWTKVL
jgi:type IV secretion system protein VirB5